MASKIVDKILEGASELFASHGYAAVSMREIALKCDVAEPSIYRLFINKERLFHACLLDAVSGSLDPAQFTLVISGDEEEGEFTILVGRAVRRWYSSLSSQSARFLMQAALTGNNQWRDIAYERIKQIITELGKAIEKDQKLSKTTALVAARTLILALFQFKVSRPLLGPGDSERQVVDRTITQWLSGLRAS